MGGGNEVENLMLVHLKCHRVIHQDEDYAAMKGWIIPQPVESPPPLWLGRSRWVDLTLGGSYRPVAEADALEWIRAAEEARGNRHLLTA